MAPWRAWRLSLMPSRRVKPQTFGLCSTEATLVNLARVHAAGRQHGHALKKEGSNGLSRVSAPAQASLTPTKVSQAFKDLLKVRVPTAAILASSHCLAID